MKIRSKKKQYNKEQSKSYLIVTIVLTLIICLIWYPAILIPIAMSFDSGYKISMIILDVSALLAPIIFLILPVIFSCLAFRKSHFQRCVKWLWINWLTILGGVSVFIIFWLIMIGALLVQA